MMRLFLLFTSAFFISCAHTIEFSNNTFFSPVTGKAPFSGTVSVASTNVTPVTLVDDITSSPPLRTGVKFENLEGIFGGASTSNLGPNANVTLVPGVELFIGNTVNGIRWQFLNGQGQPMGWVGAVQAGYTDRTDDSSKSSAGLTAKSSAKIKTTETGVSLGYQYSTVVVYGSYVVDKHTTSTTISNATGSYGPYNDSGEHRITSIGLDSTSPGFYYGIEYSLADIIWNSNAKTHKTATGFRLGYRW